MSELPEHCAVAIIGGGPAGLAAATRLRELGVADVHLLERDSEAGGIPRHCGHYPFGMREFKRLLKGPELARRLVARALAVGVHIHTQVSVMALQPGPQLQLSTPNGTRTLIARRVILATGVRETSRATRLIGGSKPGGVLPTGALQGMIYLSGQRPFERPVIVGSELVAFSALLTCRAAGIQPLAMIEENPYPTAWRAASLLPRLLGVEWLPSTRLAAIQGRERVTGVNLETPNGPRFIKTDGVILSGRFLPEASLLQGSHLSLDAGSGGPCVDQFGRCSDPNYLAAGNLLRPVETAGWSWQEGRHVAESLAAEIAGRLPDPLVEPPLSLECADPALRYVVPQRLHPKELEVGLGALQLRVSRPVNGHLELLHDGQVLHRQRLKTRPERRILVAANVLAALPPGARVELRLHEESAHR